MFLQGRHYNAVQADDKDGVHGLRRQWGGGGGGGLNPLNPP